MLRLGSFEQAVLLAVARLRTAAYGRAVLEDVRKRMDPSVKSGAVYVTLQRLEEKNLIASRWTTLAGQRARRYFILLSEGARALEKTKETIDKVWDGFR